MKTSHQFLKTFLLLVPIFCNLLPSVSPQNFRFSPYISNNLYMGTDQYPNQVQEHSEVAGQRERASYDLLLNRNQRGITYYIQPANEYNLQKVRIPQIDCSEGELRAPHPEFCNEFIECDHQGYFVVKRCPTGTIYNHAILACDWQQNSGRLYHRGASPGNCVNRENKLRRPLNTPVTTEAIFKTTASTQRPDRRDRTFVDSITPRPRKYSTIATTTEPENSGYEQNQRIPFAEQIISTPRTDRPSRRRPLTTSTPRATTKKWSRFGQGTEHPFERKITTAKPYRPRTTSSTITTQPSTTTRSNWDILRTRLKAKYALKAKTPRPSTTKPTVATTITPTVQPTKGRADITESPIPVSEYVSTTESTSTVITTAATTTKSTTTVPPTTTTQSTTTTRQLPATTTEATTTAPTTTTTEATTTTQSTTTTPPTIPTTTTTLVPMTTPTTTTQAVMITIATESTTPTMIPPVNNKTIQPIITTQSTISAEPGSTTADSDYIDEPASRSPFK